MGISARPLYALELNLTLTGPGRRFQTTPITNGLGAGLMALPTGIGATLIPRKTP